MAYLQYLKREPDAAGLQYYLDQVNNGAMSIDAVKATLLNAANGVG